MNIITDPSEYYIIDAEHLLYRNYYSNMKLHTISGKKSGAFYGFFNSLKALNDRVGAEKIIVTWGDKRESLIRRAYFSDYKGDRKDTAEDFLYQKDDVVKLCGNLNIPQYSAVNYEADDVIALLCAKLRIKYPSSHINILTGDKDLTQLVTKHISILKPDNTVIDLQNIAQKTGLQKPKHVVWFLALQGDKADCVPGIDGIGPTKAKQIIYGTGLQECKNYDDMLAWSFEYFKTSDEADSFIKSATLVDLVHSPLAIFNDTDVQVINKSRAILSNIYSAQETLNTYEVKQYKAEDLPKYLSMHTIDQMQVRNCTKCSALVRSRTHIVPHTLIENSDILFVTDSPGKDDDISGSEPLLSTSNAGRLFGKMLNNVGIQRRNDPNLTISIASIVRCRPADNKAPSAEEISNCLPYLWRDIEFTKPKLVIPMGNTALRAILGDQKISIQNLRGKVFQHRGVMLAPTWHPTYIDKSPSERSVWENDLRHAVKWIKGERAGEKVDYKVIMTVDELREYIERMKQFPTNAFDYETAGFMPNVKVDGGQALCIVMSAKPHEARLFPFCGQFLKELRPSLETEKAKALLRDWLENTPNIVKIAHNAEYELRWSVQWLGVKDIPNLQCTQLMHAAIDENSLHNLKDLAVRFTDIDRYEDEVHKWSKWHNHSKQSYFTEKPPFGKDNYAYIPDDILWEYALIDADATHRLYPIFVKEVYRQDLQEFVFKYYLRWMKFFARLKMRGFKVDMTYLTKMIATYEERIVVAKKELYALPEIKKAEKLYYEKRIREEVEKISKKYDKLKKKRLSRDEYIQKHVYDKIEPESFNFNSPKQQPILFYDVLGLKEYKSERGNPSFNKGVMARYEEEGVPFIKQLAELTSLEKFLSTFLKGAMNNIYGDRLHTDLRLDIAVTGRLSSSNPNLQNIPKRSNPAKAKEIRDMFIAEDGYMILAKDYGQMEFRCISEGSRVLMHDFTYKNIESVTAGDKILTVEETTKYRTKRKFVTATVTNTLYQGIQQCVSVKAGTHIIDVTADHKFLKVFRSKKNPLTFCRASKWAPLSSGDECITYPYDIQNRDAFLRGAIYGLYLTDGSIVKSGFNSLHLSITQTDSRVLQHAATILHELGYSVKLSSDSLYMYNHADVIKFLDDFKVTPRSSVDYKRGVISGCIQGDGWIGKGRNKCDGTQIGLGLSVTHPEVLDTVSSILRELENTLDIKYDVYKTTYREDKENKPFFIFSFRVNCASVFPLLLRGHKEERFRTLLQRLSFELLQKSTVTVTPAKKKKTYDLTTTAGTFICEGFVVHNCWAQYSQDPQMLADLNAGVDIHRFIASQIYRCTEDDVTKEQRETAKNAVFGIMYGRGVQSISAQYGISEDEATKIQRTFFARYPKAERWIKDNLQFAKKHGYVVNLYGRKRHLQATINSPVAGIRKDAERKVTNSPIQGGASDTNNIAAMLCQKRFDEAGIEGHVQLLVHDQIIAVVRKDQVMAANQLMDEVMAHPTKKISVKLISDGEIGYRLGSLVDIDVYIEKGEAAFT